MRVAAIWSLTRLHVLYVRRRVLSVGPLRDPFVRLVLAFVAVAAFAAMTVGALLFLRMTEVGPSLARLFFSVSNVSAVLWTMVVYIFVKMLFLKAGTYLSSTYQFPVSPRERQTSLGLFQAFMVLAPTMAMFLPFALALLIKVGPVGLRFAVSGIFMTAIGVYVVMAIVDAWVTGVLRLTVLHRQAQLFATVILVLAVVVYQKFNSDLISSVSREYLDGARPSFRGVNAFLYVDQWFGPLAAWAAFVCFLVVGVALLALSTPSRYSDEGRFVAVGTRWRWGARFPYALAIARRFETWVVVVVGYAVAIGLYLGSNGAAFLYACGVFVTQGVYAYAITEPLRALPNRTVTPVFELARLLGAQLALFVLTSLPVLAFIAFRPQALWTGLLVVASGASAIAVTTLLGILFPPADENPFSAFVTYSMCILVMLLAVLVLGTLSLPLAVMVPGAVFVQVLVLVYSALGIQAIQRKARHA